MVADRYVAEVAVRKATRTLADNQKEVANLKAFFDDPPAPLERIQPVDVRQYMTWRTKRDTAYVRANREKAPLSHIWNFTRDKDYTALPNPCAGIRGFKEVGRDAYVEDDQFAAIWEAADACLRDAMARLPDRPAPHRRPFDLGNGCARGGAEQPAGQD